MIVRPPEPGWAEPASDMPEGCRRAAEWARPARRSKTPPPRGRASRSARLAGGQDRDATPTPSATGRARGRRASSRSRPTRSSPASQPRPRTASEGAAHFELGQPPLASRSTATRRSRTSTSATGCSPTTGPTSARRGRSSATSRSAAATAGGSQVPVAGEEADWPFESDFRSDVERARGRRLLPEDALSRDTPNQVPQNVW